MLDCPCALSSDFPSESAIRRSARPPARILRSRRGKKGKNAVTTRQAGVNDAELLEEGLAIAVGGDKINSGWRFAGIHHRTGIWI
jgi:hypothetical protein